MAIPSCRQGRLPEKPDYDAVNPHWFCFFQQVRRLAMQLDAQEQTVSGQAEEGLP